MTDEPSLAFGVVVIEGFVDAALALRSRERAEVRSEDREHALALAHRHAQRRLDAAAPSLAREGVHSVPRPSLLRVASMPFSP